MGPDGDRDAVLDPRLSVRGVQRVADSATPLPPATTCITTMMIGEKCAEMMLEERPGEHAGEHGGDGAADRGARDPGAADFLRLYPPFCLARRGGARRRGG